MGKPSKENLLLELFFNYPSKQWHFREIAKEIKISDDRLNHWLKKHMNDNIIIRIKERGKMPYYRGNYESSVYRSRKQLYGLKKIEESGLMSYLSSIKNIKAAIIFGSFSRWDWDKESDIDLFVFGKPTVFDLAEYESKLNREIQLFEYDNKKKSALFHKGLLRSILRGYKICGDIYFAEVKPLA